MDNQLPPTKNYTYGMITTPFINRHTQWDQPIGRWRLQAYRAKVLFWISCLFNLILASLLVWVLCQPNVHVLSLGAQANGFVTQAGMLPVEATYQSNLNKLRKEHYDTRSK